MLHPDYHRQGIMQEAIETLIEYGFGKMLLHSIYANIHPDNNASRSILLKNSFVKEAHFREDFYYDGKFLDTVVFGLLNNL
jgi:ribosomal-protein-alanine N-acetyltransferase